MKTVKIRHLNLLITLCGMCIILSGCHIQHNWQVATCTEPETCSECGKTRGEALGHTWTDATCTEPQTCFVCGETQGEALGHSAGEWVEEAPDYVTATITSYQFCTTCGELLDETAENISTFCGGEYFLFSANEFASRVETILKENYNEDCVVDFLTLDDGTTWMRCSSGETTLALTQFVNYDDNENSTYITDQYENNCISYVVTKFGGDSTDIAYTSCAYVTACDPALSFSDSSGVVSKIIDASKVNALLNYNDIQYLLAEYDDGYYFSINIKQNTEAEDGTTEQTTQETTTDTEYYYNLCMTLTADDCEKDSNGYYCYNGISFLTEDCEWMDSSSNENGAIKPRAFYMKLQNCLVYFSSGNNWKSYASHIIGFTPDSRDEFEPYVEECLTYMTNEWLAPSIIEKFQTLDSVNVTENSGTYTCVINDVTECAKEMDISEEMLGYIVGALTDAGVDVQFNGSSCTLVY